MISPVEPLDREKMDITLERISSSNDHEANDLPITQTVDDSQLVKPAKMIDLKLSTRTKAPT